MSVDVQTSDYQAYSTGISQTCTELYTDSLHFYEHVCVTVEHSGLNAMNLDKITTC